MAPTSPAASQQAKDPAGTVIDMPGITEVLSAGDRIGVRVGDTLKIGTADQFVSDPAKLREISVKDCTDITANAGTFVAACGKSATLIPADGVDATSVTFPADIQSAVVTTTGEVIGASGVDPHVWVLKDGEVEEDFAVAEATDELLAQPVEGQPDTVVRILRADTTIQDVRWTEGRQGGTLRAGIGVGEIAPGKDGVVVAADTGGNQLLVYTTNDVVRLHQMAPTSDSPFAAAWFEDLAWVASTATNEAIGYDVSGGVPVESTRIPTVANVRGMASAGANLVIGGDGLQIVPVKDATSKDEGK